MDILGLPMELVELVLQRIGCCAAMRLGLSNPLLLKWLNAHEKYWDVEYRECGMDIKSFGPTLPSKKRVAMRFSAIRNIKRPDFNNWHLLQRIGFYAVQSSMQQGGTLCLCHFIDFLGDDDSLSVTKLIDLSSWPNFHSASLGEFATQTEKRIMLAKRMLVFDPENEQEAHLDTLGIFSLGGDVARSPMDLDVDLFSQIVILPTDAMYDRIAFLRTPYALSDDSSDEENDSILFRVYDVGRDMRGDELALPGLAALHSFTLTGNFFCAHAEDKQIMLVKIDDISLRPSIIFNGPLSLDQFGTDCKICLTRTSLLILFLSNEGSELVSTDPGQEMKLVGIPFDQLGDSAAVARCFESDALCLPHMRKAELVAHDALAVVFGGTMAVLIDLHRSEVLRYMKCCSELVCVYFVDSTVLVLHLEDRSIVIDLLERRVPTDPFGYKGIKFGFTAEDFDDVNSS